MYYCTLLLLMFITFVICEEFEVYTGNACADSNGTVGSCTGVKDCRETVHSTRNGRNAGVCGYEGFDPVICCITNNDDDDIISRFQPACEPGSPSCPLTKIRRKSRALEKCAEYQKQICGPYDDTSTPLIFEVPGGIDATFGEFPHMVCTTIECAEYHKQTCGTPDYTRLQNERADAHKTRADFRFGHALSDTVVVVAHGTDSILGEFPHMALLGYGQNISTAEWNCGGSIISETFILTAGHCTSGRDIGSVKFAATGILRRSDQILQSRLHKIKRIIKHPDYNPPHKYNDIALLETWTVMVHKHQYHIVSVACLNSYDITVDDATVTGWGAIEHRGMVADVLQRAELHRFPDDVCFKKYPPSRLLKHGFDNKTQMCYGHHTRPRDTCQGDSGGPLQIETDEFPCLYTVIGVTSFGRACGTAGEPGIYTRVSPYVPWIESVVWPSP